MKKNNDVGTPIAMIDNDNQTMCSGGAECVEGKGCHESLKSRQGLDLYDEVVTLVQKISLFHHEATE